jgi:hypothetical protein
MNFSLVARDHTNSKKNFSMINYDKNPFVNYFIYLLVLILYDCQNYHNFYYLKHFLMYLHFIYQNFQ